MAKTFERQDQEKEHLIAFYKRFTKEQINAIYETMSSAYDKLMIDWSMVLINQKKVYCDIMKLKLEILLDLINGF